MHQLWKHPNGKWYVLYGARLKRRISTGTKDRRQAESFLAQFIAGQQNPVIDAPTVRAILEAYRDDHGKGLRGQDGLRYGIGALVEHIGDLTPENLNPPTIKKYAADRGAANGTILREIGILRAALGWAARHKVISYVPAIENPVSVPPPRSRWLTKDEARKLIASCTEPHVRLFITLGLMTGARLGAILEVKWGQVDLRRESIDYGQGHGNKRRAVVKLNPEVLEALKGAKTMAASDYVIEFRGRPVKTMKTGFNAAACRAGLKGVTPHILRHSAATWAAIEGRPLQEIARMLGDSLATVERVYAKWTPDYLTDTVAALQLKTRPTKKRLHPVRRPGVNRGKRGQQNKNKI